MDGRRFVGSSIVEMNLAVESAGRSRRSAGRFVASIQNSNVVGRSVTDRPDSGVLMRLQADGCTIVETFSRIHVAGALLQAVVRG